MKSEMTAGEAAGKLEWLAEHILADDCMNMPDCKQAAEMAVSILRRVESGELREVVRCGKCEFYHPECPYENACIKQKMSDPLPNDFCSYGERKDGEK